MLSKQRDHKKNDLFFQSKSESKSKTDYLAAFDPIETSKKALLKCNAIRGTNSKIKRILKGEGHLASIGDRSVNQMY
jgi:hypothetical protein